MKCQVCGKTNSKVLGGKNSFEILKCQNCQLTYVKKIEDSTNDFDYSNYYSEENLEVPDFVYDTYKNVIQDFEPHRINNRFLDVGCGAGTLLEVARTMNWEATGVEVSKPAVEHLKTRGFNIFEGTLEEAQFPDDHFDVITCTEVIEHVPNPKEVIKEISRVLNPKGILWITTPHGNGLAAKLLGPKWSVVAPPEHLNLFSVKSMQMCLEEAGFRNFRIVSTGFNFMEVYRILKKSESAGREKSDVNGEPEKRDSKAETERVETSYQLNEWFSGGKNKQQLKQFINSMLSAINAGDTIKVWATFE